MGSFVDVISGLSLEPTFCQFLGPPGVCVEVSEGAFWGLDRRWELLGISMDFGISLGTPQNPRNAPR